MGKPRHGRVPTRTRGGEPGCRSGRLAGVGLVVAALLASISVLVPAPMPAAATTSVPARLFVTSFNGSVSTLDTGSDAFVAGPVSLGGASFPWAVAITPDGSTAYVAGLGSNNVTPISVGTMATGTNLCLPVGTCPASADAQPQAVAITPDGSTAYVVNSGLDTVSVVLLAQGRVSSSSIQLPRGTRPSAIAIGPDGTRAYVAAYATGQVFPITLPSGIVGAPITVGPGPTGLALTPDGLHLFVANSGGAVSGSVSHVRVAASPPAVTTFNPEPTETGFISPYAVAISPNGQMAYVTDVVTNRLIPISVATDVPSASVAVGRFPVAVAVSPDGSAAYVANQLGDSISALALNGTGASLTATIPSAKPSALAFVPDQAPIAAFGNGSAATGAPVTFDASASRTNPAGGALTYRWDFGDGGTAGPLTTPLTTHTYVAPGTYTVTLTVTTASGTSTAQVFTGQTVSRNGGPSATTTRPVTITQATLGSGPIAVVATGGTGAVTPVGLDPTAPSAVPGPPVPVGAQPGAVAITPDGRTAYVTNAGSGSVTPVTIASSLPGPAIAVGTTPEALAITPDGTAAYVVDAAENRVRRITVATGAVGPPIAVGNAPSAIAIHPDGTRAYVANAADNTVTPIDLTTGIAGNPVAATGLVNPVAVAVHPAGNVAYVVSGGTPTSAGGVTSFDLSGATPQPVQTVGAGGVGARPTAIAVGPSGTAAYVTTAAGTVVRLTLNGAVMTVAANTPVAASLAGIAISPDGGAAYATGTANGPGGAFAAVVPLRLTPAVQVGTAVAVGAQPRGIAITPDQAPVAQLSVLPSSPQPAPATVTLDASASSNPSSPIVRYDWAFGDGTTASTTTPAIAHTYAVTGSFTATVTLTDAAGTSTTQVFTGQTVSRNGSAQARAAGVVVVTSDTPTSTTGTTGTTLPPVTTSTSTPTKPTKPGPAMTTTTRPPIPTTTTTSRPVGGCKKGCP